MMVDQLNSLNSLNSAAELDAAWPNSVRFLLTTRQGGLSAGSSQGNFSSFNLGLHVGDDAQAVAANRAQLAQQLGDVQLVWLDQVHGTSVIDAADFVEQNTFNQQAAVPTADAAFTRALNVGCVVMSADCLPVLLCDEAGTVVGAAHAGWRGLLAGVLEKTISAMHVPSEKILAYLAPAIGAEAFEVGDEVRAAFMAAHAEAALAFKPVLRGAFTEKHQEHQPKKWLADIYTLARQRLARQGVTRIFGGDYCTFSDPQRFFSYRRDGQTGRMAAIIWIAPG